MKKLILALLMGLSLNAQAATTNFPGGISVGTSPSTLVAITGAAYSYLEIPLGTVRGGDGYEVPAAVSIATGVYTGTLTGLSNAAGIIMPAVNDATLTAQIVVPQNYMNSGVFIVGVHASAVTNVASSGTITAHVYTQTPDAATITTQVIGTAVTIPTTAGVQVNNLVLTHAGSNLSGGKVVFLRLVADAILYRKEIAYIRFRYRPYGVIR